MNKIFISYDYVNDNEYKQILLTWNANYNFNFVFEDTSADVSINSTDTAIIERVLTAKIKNSDYFLCIIGKKTCKSAWVKWEISKAVALGKKIVAVKIHSSNRSPVEIVAVGASWATQFRFESIKAAIDNVK